LCGPGAPAGEHGAVFGFDRYHLDGRFARLEYLTDASDGAGGSDAGNHHIHAALCVVPDLFGRRAAVDFRIGRIFELLGHDRPGRGPQDFVGTGKRALHALGGLGEFELRAQEQQHLAPLQRHGIGHDQDEMIPARCGDEGERDSGIATGGFDQHGLAGRDFPLFFQGIDHGDADAILTLERD
jgi:hypothetical protein